MDADTEELEQELAEGNQAAQKLAEHLHAMGAEKNERLVNVDGEPYAVTVQKGDKRKLK